MSNFEKVRKFMKTFGQEVREKPGFPDDKITSLRYDLITEEIGELKVAMGNKDIKEEVQDSNMSKLGSDGKPIYNEKGKVMKGPNYFKPDLGKYVA